MSKIRLDDIRYVPERGNSRDTLEKELHGYCKFSDLDLFSKKEVVKLLRKDGYKDQDIRAFIEKYVFLLKNYFSIESKAEMYLAIVKACEKISLSHKHKEAIEFVEKEMDKLVENKYWSWTITIKEGILLPRTDFLHFRKETKRKKK